MEKASGSLILVNYTKQAVGAIPRRSKNGLFRNHNLQFQINRTRREILDKKGSVCFFRSLNLLFAQYRSEAFSAAIAKGNCQFHSFPLFVWSTSHFPSFLGGNFFSAVWTFWHIHDSTIIIQS